MVGQLNRLTHMHCPNLQQRMMCVCFCVRMGYTKLPSRFFKAYLFKDMNTEMKVSSVECKYKSTDIWRSKFMALCKAHFNMDQFWWKLALPVMLQWKSFTMNFNKLCDTVHRIHGNIYLLSKWNLFYYIYLLLFIYYFIMVEYQNCPTTCNECFPCQILIKSVTWFMR